MSNNNLILGLENFLQTGDKIIANDNPQEPRKPGEQVCYGVILVERR